MERISFLIVSKEVVANKRISATAKLLLATLRDYRNRKTGQCNPSRKKLAERLGVSEPTITRALAALERCGFIQRVRCFRGRRYTFPTNQIDPSIHGSKRSASTDQNDPPNELDLLEPKRRSSATRPSAAAAASPTPKPPASAQESGAFSYIRESLDALAQEAHMPPPDDDLVRRVIAAARGASGENIHATLVALWKRGRFRSIQSWGLVPFLIAQCYGEAHRRAATR